MFSRNNCDLWTVFHFQYSDFFFFSEKLVKKMKLISIKTVFLRVVLQLYRMWFDLTRIINSFRLKDDEMYQVLVQFCVTLSFRLLTRCVRIQIKRKKNHHPFIVDYCAVVIRHRSGAVLSVHVISRDKLYTCSNVQKIKIKSSQCS